MRAGNRENVVLVADDDLFVRTVIAKGLKELAAVEHAGDGKEVFAAYKKHMPDMVFLDIHLPGISGIELLGQILEFDPHAYVVMVSADSTRTNVQITGMKGAKGFMTKPFEKDRLLAHLAKCPTIKFLDK